MDTQQANLFLFKGCINSYLKCHEKQTALTYQLVVLWLVLGTALTYQLVVLWLVLGTTILYF